MNEMAGAEAPEIIAVSETRVACDGGAGPLGHPRVFLEMGDEEEILCPYCGRLYKLKPQGGSEDAA